MKTNRAKEKYLNAKLYLFDWLINHTLFSKIELAFKIRFLRNQKRKKVQLISKDSHKNVRN